MNRFLLVIVLFTLSFACMKKPDLNATDGASVDPVAVQQALSGAWGTADPLSMSQNEEAYIELSNAVAGTPPRVTLMDDKSIGSVSDTAASRSYVIMERITQIDDNNQQSSGSNLRTITIDKTTSQQVLRPFDSSQQVVPLGIETLGGLVGACVKAANWDVECYNLNIWDSIEPAPPLVAAKSDCGGLASCQVHVKNVSFDAFVNTVAADKSKVRSKITYEIKISPDLPFMARLLSYCYTGLGSAQNYNFPVTTCESLRNFQRGL